MRPTRGREFRKELTLCAQKFKNGGNSLAVRIPKALAHGAQLENDSVVEITMAEGQIIITPVIASGWTLDELLKGIHKNNIHHKVDTGFALGNEVW